MKFSNKSESLKGTESGWIDKINKQDIEDGKPGWLNQLLDLLPYKQHANLVFDPKVLKEMDIAKKGCQNEKVYAYACFMPPGRFSSSILYNIESQSRSQKNKSLYTMQVKVKPRDYAVKVRYKKVRQFRVERKFS